MRNRFEHHRNWLAPDVGGNHDPELQLQRAKEARWLCAGVGAVAQTAGARNELTF